MGNFSAVALCDFEGNVPGTAASLRSNATVVFTESTMNDATARDTPEIFHVSGTFELKDSAMNSASDCIVQIPAQNSQLAIIADII